ncbi:MAG: hypothetical protein ACHQ50_07785 [Fimbriimonadales bacterium]
MVVPDLLGEPSVLRQKLPTLERMAEMGHLFKLGPLPQVETPEALYLGMNPNQGQLRQGPLTVAALGADPPERSTHFHLSLMSVTAGIVSPVSTPNAQRPTPLRITPEEQRQVMDLAKKLNTKTLTIVEGEGLDHGLVWEELGDLRTTPASQMEGERMRPHLPEGDAEVALRRFIDDSINLLSEIEMNQQRIDEDLPPLNLLWPWGEGVRTPVPNLALRRGEPALVISSSMRLAGLTRLAGYRHCDRHEFGHGLNTRLAKIAERCLQESVAIIFIDAFAEFKSEISKIPMQSGRNPQSAIEESFWFARELDSALLQPLFDHALTHSFEITLLAPVTGSPPDPPTDSSRPGLGLVFTRSSAPGMQHPEIPFDERAFDERKLAVATLWEAVARSLA